MIRILRSRQVRNSYELAEALGVSRRTVFRDLALLVDAGIYCHYRPGQGYEVDLKRFFPEATNSPPTITTRPCTPSSSPMRLAA
jgi:predicted DNA-binding transcriptional regulator YafY